MRQQASLFDNYRMQLDDAVQLSIASLNEYGARYKHWALAYSGGKDSTAALTFVVWAINSGLVVKPETLTVLYADTRMELPPLQDNAIQILRELNKTDFIQSRVVLPEIDKRFYVYMFGRGVPPPKNRFRWCTPQIKVEPMLNALESLRTSSDEKLLMLTGVRLGESAARDQRIAISCSKDAGECGQGWFQNASSEAVADTLAPLLHWRLCHVYDWLYFDSRHGFDTSGIAAIYGEEDVRTGCVGCNLVDHDTALERLVKIPRWEHLRSLLELKPLYRELTQAKYRKRKSGPEMRKDGQWSKNAQRLGPLTMAAREYGLNTVLDIQKRAGVNLICKEEENRIRELWKLNTWPNKWSDQDIDGDVFVEPVYTDGKSMAVQKVLSMEIK